MGQEKPQQPANIAAMWTEGVVHASGGVPMRGVAGRIIFYGPDEKKAVKVDGTLTIYGFDEAGRGKTDAKPDRKYVFTPEQLATHYDPVKVGPAYAVWIPWDEASGPRKEVSLIVRFVPRKGELVVGEMTRLVLNGSVAPSDNVAADGPRRGNASVSDPRVRPASFESPTPNRPGEMQTAEGSQGGIRSTTIPLPDNLTRHLAASRPASATVATRGAPTTVIPGGVAAANASRLLPTASASTAQTSSPPGSTIPAAGLPLRPSVLPGAHSPLQRPRVPGVVIAPLTRDHAASRQSPATPPSPPEPTPPTEPPRAGALISPDSPLPQH